jgi:hypothetical protein
MEAEMSLLTFAIAPLFFSVPFGAGRPRGHKLLGGITLYMAYVVLMTVLFGSIWLVNHVILSALYGPVAAFSGQIWIVKGRTFIELSNGDRYAGVWSFLWGVAIFVTVAALGGSVLWTARRVYLHCRLVRRVADRLELAVTAKSTAK